MRLGARSKELARELGVTDQTLYNWKSKYGGLEISDAKRLWALEEENRRLKEMVADLNLDKEALKTVIRKNGWSFPSCERAAGRDAADGGTSPSLNGLSRAICEALCVVKTGSAS